MEGKERTYSIRDCGERRENKEVRERKKDSGELIWRIRVEDE